MATIHVLHFQLFGPPALVRRTEAGQDEIVLGPGKPLLILAYLAAHPGGASRETLATLGWGEQDDQRARGSLRQAIYRLRSLLGPDALDATDEHVTLRVEATSDRQQFLDAIAAGDDAAAIALYRGPFLAGVPSSDVDGLGQWDTRERQRLAALWRDAALREADRHLGLGDRTTTARIATELTEAHPTLIAAWALRLAATDDPSLLGAHRDARAQLEALLADGTLRGSDAETARGLLVPTDTARPIPGAHRPLPPPPRELPLVGRTLMLQRLEQLAHATNPEHRPGIVLLEGAAGLGKSRLLRELATRCAERGEVTLTVTAYAAERTAAWAFLAHVVRAVLRLPGALGIAPAHAAALLTIAPDLANRFRGVQGAGQDVPKEETLTEAVADLLAAAHSTRRFILLLDDLHFADPRSLSVLGQAMHRAGDDAPALVAGARPGVRSVPAHWPRWQVPALDRDELAALWDRALGLQVDSSMLPVAEATLLVTGGIPIAVARAFRQLEASGILHRRPSGEWSVHDLDGMPQAITGLMLHRDPSFPADRVAQAILGYCTAAQDPISRDELERALAGTSPDAIATTLETLVIGGWVTLDDGGDRIALTHAVMADQVARALGDGAVRGWRRTRAEWLVRHGTTLGELQQLMAILVTAGDGDAALSAVRQWRRRTRQRLFGMADVLAPDGASRLFRARLRLVLSPNAWVAPVAVAIVLAAIGVGLNAWLRQPAMLRLENSPVLMPTLDTNHVATWRSNNNPPVFRVYDRLGRPVSALTGDTLVVRQQHGDARLANRTTTTVRDGMVAATGVTLLAPSGGPRDSVVAVFEVGPARSRPITLFRPAVLAYRLELADGTLAGQLLSRREPTIRVAPGAPIEGEVLLHYTTPSDPVIYWLAESSTFGDIASDTVTVASLHYNATDGYLSARVRRAAPTMPGTYWLAWATAPETAAHWVLSATNWRCGTPTWGDGNDLMARDDLASAWGGGILAVERQLCDGPGTPARLTQRTPVVTVKVVVE
ncbi:MAG TPA: AAA family ATPase [Gemmatimonadales bacterium]|nr:AAA family ATPase [Gemmatimonadales bacterium]